MTAERRPFHIGPSDEAGWAPLACGRKAGLARPRLQPGADQRASLIAVRRFSWAAGAVLILVWTGTALAQSADLSAFRGQKLAEHYCGGCHAIASGPSPLADAPPFADLHRRYFEGGLDDLLAKGMLAPLLEPWREPVRVHPRMPMARLNQNQAADLKAYLESLDPRRAADTCYVINGRRRGQSRASSLALGTVSRRECP